MASKKNEVLWAQRQHEKAAGFDALGEFLIEAVRSGQEVRVRDALIKGANINYKCQCPTNPPIWNIGSMTPLMLAAHRNDMTIVQLLLEKKADKTLTNHLGRKAADYAKDDKIKQLLV